VATPQVLLDASALLAWLLEEPGFDVVDAVLDHAAITSVNAAEVVHKLIRKGAAPEEAQRILDEVCLTVLDFTDKMSRECGRYSHHAGLSMGDRVCLAAGLTLESPVYTADRQWAALGLGGAIRLIR